MTAPPPVPDPLENQPELPVPDPLRPGDALPVPDPLRPGDVPPVPDPLGPGETPGNTGVGTGDPDPGKKPQGSGKNVPGILNGAELVKVRVKGGEDLWFAKYEFPKGSGSFVMFQFDSVDQVKATLGEDFNTSGDFIIRKRQEDFLRRDNVDIVDSAASVTGLRGNFNRFIEDLMFKTAQEAGLRDPGLIGEYLNSPEIQKVLALGALGEWSPERIQAEVRNTNFYQNELYPGIVHFLNTGSSNPEAEYKQYMGNVTAALDLLGFPKDEKGTYRTAVGQLLAAGVSDDMFVQMAPTFLRAQNSGAYADVLGQWTQRTLGKELSFDDLFDVFDGSATQDLLNVVEAANLQFSAEQEGVEVGRRRIERIVAETDLTEAQAQAAFNTVEQQLLALDRVILEGRFGLRKGELIDAAAGIAPGSGRSIQEVRNLARKAATEEGLLDDQKQALFVGFNPKTGTPFRPGLSPLSPEGA